MLGKRRKIRELEEFRNTYRAAEQYIPLAQEIGRRVTARVAAMDGDPDKWLESILDSAEEDHKKEALLQLYQTLPPEQQLDLLERHFDDQLFIESLADERGRLITAHQQRNTLDGWAETARQTGSFDLGLLPPELRVRIELYDEEELEDSDPAELPEQAWDVRTLELISLGDGEFQLLGDRHDDSYNLSLPAIRTHQKLRLGSLMAKEPELEFSNKIYLGSQVYCLIEGQPSLLELKSHGDTFNIIMCRLVVGDKDIFKKEKKSK